MDPYIIRTGASNTTVRRICLLREMTQQICSLTRPDIAIDSDDLEYLKLFGEHCHHVLRNKTSDLKCILQFYEDAALRILVETIDLFFLISTRRQQKEENERLTDAKAIVDLNDRIWTDYWYVYDSATPEVLNERLLSLYTDVCDAHKQVLINCFDNTATAIGTTPQKKPYNPYECKQCILDSAYVGIGRFENVCDLTKTDYVETFTKTIHINQDTGFCCHVHTSISDRGRGKCYEFAIAEAQKLRNKTSEN